ncbi:MAG: twin-arginine translocase TatA/TatE family subunit [Lutibacter sp.]|jgi:sec-independent protein translocase protein TatA|nr:twin-arginine translocase TatA/TatE family subunit [Lutibacter sp.]
MLLFISGTEIFVVLIIVVMLFGADRIPEIARGLGKGMRQVREATNEIKQEIKNSAQKHEIDLDITSQVKEEVDKIKEDFEDINKPVDGLKKTLTDEISGPIKRGP